MLAAYPPDLPVWIDLASADAGEAARAAAITGLRVPDRAALSEIESSSRLAHDSDAIYLSMPVAARDTAGLLISSPLGIVLTPRHLLTIRYQPVKAIDGFAARLAQTPPTRSIDVFAGLLEAIVDRLADVLEHLGADLDELSRTIFRADEAPPARADRVLRATLRSVGQTAESTSRIRDSLLGIGRMVAYVAEIGADWIPEEAQHRFKTLRQDVTSLTDYDSQLANKVQFLLDATLGFINIEQNQIIKILTVVSVVGIPPTLLASIYGMNFKNIPEYDWTYGYQYGWTVIIASALLPLIIFKWRGWL